MWCSFPLVAFLASPCGFRAYSPVWPPPISRPWKRNLASYGRRKMPQARIPPRRPKLPRDAQGRDIRLREYAHAFRSQSALSEETLQADAHLDQDRLPAAASRVLIPESLRTPPPPEAATVRTVSVKRSPSLLSQLEPVSLPENLSQGLLLQKVPPSYPEQAL